MNYLLYLVYLGLSYWILSSFFVWYFFSLKKYNIEILTLSQSFKKGWKIAPELIFNELVILVIDICIFFRGF